MLIPTCGASDWRQFLADPDIQWQRAASAMELAASWEVAQKTPRGLPLEVGNALDTQPSLQGASLLIALPEHKVPLKGRGKPSQSDVWALLRAGNNYVSMTVEGKAGEPFGPTVSDWLKQATDGKRERLEYLCELLHVPAPGLELRYQLFHRTASALIEAQRFGASLAVMLVQSFAENPQAWNDYSAFCSLLGASASRGGLVEASRNGDLKLFLGWVDSKVASDAALASVV